MYANYLILFDLLEYCYPKSDDFDLPPFLGELCPYLWGGMPIDCSAFDKWQKDSISLNTNQELLQGVIKLLESYEHLYHFDFADTKKVLSEISNDELTKIIQESEEKYRLLQKNKER